MYHFRDEKTEDLERLMLAQDHIAIKWWCHKSNPGLSVYKSCACNSGLTSIHSVAKLAEFLQWIVLVCSPSFKPLVGSYHKR